MEEPFPPSPPPPDELPEAPAVPEDFHGFCSRCFYNLHGLADPRCPECAKPFDPADPRTFSYAPRSDRLRKMAGRTTSSLLEALKSLNQPDPEATRRAWVARQLTELRRENAALRQEVATLKWVLLAKGVLGPADLEAVDRETEQVMLGPEIIDDTEPPDNPDNDEPSPDLLDLGRAAREDRGVP